MKPLGQPARCGPVAIACCRASPSAAADDRYPDPDNPLLLAALQELGVACVLLAWDDAAVDWASFPLVVIRSTWDSVDRPDEFLRWVGTVAAVTRLENPAAVIEWNLDKRYLAELEGLGVPIPTTRWVTSDEELDLPSSQFVVKPSVSGGGRGTALYGPENAAEAREHIRSLLGQGATPMVQEYLTGVEANGEIKHVFIAGTFSHAIRTGPLLEPGAGVLNRPWERPLFTERATPTQAQLEVARTALACSLGCAGATALYARVDVVDEPGGIPVVLEVELVDPSLALWANPTAPLLLAEAITRTLGGSSGG